MVKSELSSVEHQLRSVFDKALSDCDLILFPEDAESRSILESRWSEIAEAVFDLRNDSLDFLFSAVGFSNDSMTELVGRPNPVISS